MLRVMDLPHWPPDCGGVFQTGELFPISAESVIIAVVERVDGENIVFTCTFEGKSHSYDYAAPSVHAAGKLASILRANVGKTLFSVGVIELPHRED